MPPADHTTPKNWREASRAAMYDASLGELRGRMGTEQVSFNYRWEHVTAVVTLALRLAELTGADADIVEAAAWLHDVRKFSDGQRHPQAGADFARRFLPTTDFPPQKIEAVAEAIADHMGLWRDEPLTVLESQVLWDADKLTKIGLTAVFHWAGGRLAGDETRTLDDLIAGGRDADWQTKALASMHTEPAKRAAEARLAAQWQVYDDLEWELAGGDLRE